MHRNQLHLCDEIALILNGRHERARPGRRVLDKGPCERNAGLIRVADCVRGAGVRNTCHRVNLLVAHVVAFCEFLTAAHAHGLDGYALVGRGGIAVVDPEEGADAHLLSGGGEGCERLRGHHGNFAGAQFAEVLIAEVQIGKTLEGGAVALRLAPHNNRRSTELVAGQIDALRGQEHNAHGAVNHFLGVAKSLDQIVFAVNQRCDQLGRIDEAAAHLEEGGAVVL